MTTCIHIIDDDDALRDSLAALVSCWSDLRVETWATGSAFLAAARNLEPGVLLLDHDMPGATGLDVLRSVASDPRFSVVLMTGGANIRLAVEAFRAGAIDLIEKPCDPDVIRAALSQAVSRVEAGLPRLQARKAIARLAPRERDVLDGLVAGQSNKIIAYAHGISPRTVEVYRANLLKKLGAQSVADVVRLAFIVGWAPETNPGAALLAA